MPRFVFNPRIISKSTDVVVDREGCLSIPGLWIPVERSSEIEVAFDDCQGTNQTLALKGELARVFQHEIDHLDGKLIVDYVDRKTRFTIRANALKRKMGA